MERNSNKYIFKQYLIVLVYIFSFQFIFFTFDFIPGGAISVWGMMVFMTFSIWSKERLIFKSEAELFAMIEKPKGRWDT